MTRRPLVLAATASLFVAACSDDGGAGSTASSLAPSVETTDAAATTAPAATDPPATEPSTTLPVVPTVSLAVVPLPDHITEVQLPWWTADGRSVVVSARSTEFPGMQIVRVDPDGSNFACLTCAIAEGEPPLMKPIAFDDGQRVLIRIGNQTPFTNGDHAVLECTPSVAQCDQAELVPIVVPVDDAVVQPQREFRVAPGGDRVGFTQMRTNARGEPVYVAVVASLRRAEDHYELDDPRVVSHKGELKEFSADGSTVYISSFVEGPEAGNGDVVAVDLVTGDERRITYYPDYDEPVEPSPDGHWFTVGSARTAGLFEAIAQVRRPNVLGAAISPLALYLFNTYRDELLEPWLITAEGEAGGEVGVLLNPGSVADGWEGRMIPNWNVDGRRIVFWEAAVDSAAGSADAGSRLVVATVDGLGEPGPAATVTSPDLTWAPTLTGFVPPADLPASREGLVSGSMEVVVTDGDELSITVTYTGFSDGDELVLDGTETITNAGGPTGSLTYTADITVSGGHSGYLRATGVSGTAAGGFTGRVESELDGRTVTLQLG